MRGKGEGRAKGKARQDGMQIAWWRLGLRGSRVSGTQMLKVWLMCRTFSSGLR